MNSARPHTDGSHHEGDTTRVDQPWSGVRVTMPRPGPANCTHTQLLLCSPAKCAICGKIMGPPTPAASGPFPDDDLTHETFADRLRSIRYREPVAQPQRFTCSIKDCGLPSQANELPCERCQEEIDAYMARDEQDKAVLNAFLAGAVLGAAITIALLWVSGVIL